ncbi:hypothetical protein [Moraxella oblonga]|uniref:hypothetical protein n=1 Tax=Moraxella oblonga TaxID=200413 RepID=UPI000AD1C628|nr:hypothetical protein [Moraxella oblonga]
MRIILSLLVLVLAGCQHIQLVKHPLPFNDKNDTITPSTQPLSKVNTDNKALEGVYILENWF